MALSLVDIDASCAICGAPSTPECPHEGQRLEIALNQAMERWDGMKYIREWVLNHAREQVIMTFHQLRATRYQRTVEYLQTVPSYHLYITYHGNPPMQPMALHQLRMVIEQANQNFKAGVDEDWRRSCLRYPEILDYYFSLVDVTIPHEKDPNVLEPRFGAPVEKAPKKIKAKRDSVELSREHRKKDRRRTTTPPPPPVPMPGAFPRR